MGEKTKEAGETPVASAEIVGVWTGMAVLWPVVLSAGALVGGQSLFDSVMFAEVAAAL